MRTFDERVQSCMKNLMHYRHLVDRTPDGQFYGKVVQLEKNLVRMVGVDGLEFLMAGVDAGYPVEQVVRYQLSQPDGWLPVTGQQENQ